MRPLTAPSGSPQGTARLARPRAGAAGKAAGSPRRGWEGATHKAHARSQHLEERAGPPGRRQDGKSFLCPRLRAATIGRGAPRRFSHWLGATSVRRRHGSLQEQVRLRARGWARARARPGPSGNRRPPQVRAVPGGGRGAAGPALHRGASRGQRRQGRHRAGLRGLRAGLLLAGLHRWRREGSPGEGTPRREGEPLRERGTPPPKKKQQGTTPGREGKDAPGKKGPPQEGSGTLGREGAP